MIIKSRSITHDPITTPSKAGEVHTAIFSHTFLANMTAASDILEIGALIPFAQIVDASVVGENIGTTALTVGYMTGDYASSDAGRTSGNELFNAVAANVEATVPLASVANLAPNGDAIKSIGVKIGTNIVAAANKKVHVRLSYRF